VPVAGCVGAAGTIARAAALGDSWVGGVTSPHATSVTAAAMKVSRGDIERGEGRIIEERSEV
jgi:hypothetical protein